MATPERLAPSRRLQSAATAERDRLGRELGRLDAKAQELRAGLDQIEATRAELRDQLSLLARLAHSTEDSPFPLRARHLRAVGGRGAASHKGHPARCAYPRDGRLLRPFRTRTPSGAKPTTSPCAGLRATRRGLAERTR